MKEVLSIKLELFSEPFNRESQITTKVIDLPPFCNMEDGLEQFELMKKGYTEDGELSSISLMVTSLTDEEYEAYMNKALGDAMDIVKTLAFNNGYFKS